MVEIIAFVKTERLQLLARAIPPLPNDNKNILLRRLTTGTLILKQTVLIGNLQSIILLSREISNRNREGSWREGGSGRRIINDISLYYIF